MTEQEWITNSEWYLLLNHINGKVSDRKLRLFACACCRQIWSKIADPRIRNAVIVTERFADGDVTLDEMHTATSTALRARDIYESPTSDEDRLKFIREAIWASSAARSSTRSIAKEAAEMASSAAIHAGGKFNLQIIRDLVGNPFRTHSYQSLPKTQTILQLAQSMYADRDFIAMPILGDALEEAGCSNEEILRHCRSNQEHYRGCWVVDLILGKE